MNNNIENENRNKLEKVKEYISKKIVWENYMKNNDMKSVYNKKCYYNIRMKTYNTSDLIQELSFKYYDADIKRIKLEKIEKKYKKLLEENKLLLEKIKKFENQNN